MRSEDLFYWIKERHQIYVNRANGLPRPWTNDPILQDYRFCNVYRELDKVTMWIAKNWRDPHKGDPYLFFAIAISRLINWPDTLRAMGYPTSLSHEQFVGTVHARQEAGLKAYSGAYIVSTNGNQMDKAEYLFNKVLAPLWVAKDNLRPTRKDTLRSFYERLIKVNGLGTFMAAQIVADMKYVAPLCNAPDWKTFAAPGPGSKRGLNRVYNQPIDRPWGSKHEWIEALLELKEEIDELALAHAMPDIHAQDLQNCLCEFDKYERVRLNEGRPRSSFAGR